MINFTNTLIAAYIAIATWLPILYLLHKIYSLKKDMICKVMGQRLEIREQAESITQIEGALFSVSEEQQKIRTIVDSIDERINNLQGNHNLRVDDIVDLRKRASTIEVRVNEIDTRTEEVKKAKDYIDSGYVFGWDAVSSKFAWIKRDEDKGGIPEMLHIKTDSIEGPSND